METKSFRKRTRLEAASHEANVSATRVHISDTRSSVTNSGFPSSMLLRMRYDFFCRVPLASESYKTESQQANRLIQPICPTHADFQNVTPVTRDYRKDMQPVSCPLVNMFADTFGGVMFMAFDQRKGYSICNISISLLLFNICHSLTKSTTQARRKGHPEHTA